MNSTEIILNAIKEGRLSIEEGKQLLDDLRYRVVYSYPTSYPYITYDNSSSNSNDKNFEYTTTTNGL